MGEEKFAFEGKNLALSNKTGSTERYESLESEKKDYKP